jgi:hypothetical protein
MFLPSFSSVVWSAFRAGSCSLVSWRVSLRSQSGRVATAYFASPAAAASFARSWASLLGRSVVVRRAALGWPCRPAWVVSVPVLAWPGSQSSGQVAIRGAGGMRGVAACLRALGFVSAAV